MRHEILLLCGAEIMCEIYGMQQSGSSATKWCSETKWNGINEHFMQHIGINKQMLYFLLQPLKKGGWGVGMVFCAVGEKTACITKSYTTKNIRDK